jgi:hypothetical protein
MSRISSGVGAIAFAALTIAAFAVGNPPGGNYATSDVTSYTSSSHQLPVFISLYLGLLAALGLIALLAGVRPAIGDDRLQRIFWGSGLAAAAASAIGWCLITAAPLALTFGSAARPIDPKLTYILMEAGFVIIFGAGGLLFGSALLTLALGSPGMLPTWLRWATTISGIAGIASLAFFPSFLVLIWALTIGVWLLLTARAGKFTSPVRVQATA